jgi:predicted patatin/cPLA2 family phospholipase
LSEAYRENPEINELKIKNEQEYRNILQILSKEEKSVPLFIEINDNVYLVSEFEKLGVKKENFLFYYLGKEIEENYKSNSKD